MLDVSHVTFHFLSTGHGQSPTLERLIRLTQEDSLVCIIDNQRNRQHRQSNLKLPLIVYVCMQFKKLIQFGFPLIVTLD